MPAASTEIPKGMSVKQLIKSTLNEPDAVNARHITIKSVELGRDGKKRLFAKIKMFTHIPDKNVSKHTVLVTAVDPASTKLMDGKVLIDCDCPRFAFNWEYALHKRGAAVIKRCNGDPPINTNPNLKPSPCKHGFAALHRILRKNY